MSAATRIYRVIGADQQERYVECATRAQAIQHVYAPVCSGPLTGAQVRKLLSEQPDAIEQITKEN